MSKPSSTAVPGKLSTTLRVSANQKLLYDELRSLIARIRQNLAGAVTNPCRRLKFSEVFPGAEILSTLSTKLSWNLMAGGKDE